MELAITVDFGKKITDAIYELEGDGFLALKAYDMIKGLEKDFNFLQMAIEQRVPTQRL